MPLQFRRSPRGVEWIGTVGNRDGQIRQESAVSSNSSAIVQEFLEQYEFELQKLNYECSGGGRGGGDDNCSSASSSSSSGTESILDLANGYFKAVTSGSTRSADAQSYVAEQLRSVPAGKEFSRRRRISSSISSRKPAAGKFCSFREECFHSKKEQCPFRKVLIAKRKSKIEESKQLKVRNYFPQCD